MSHTRHITMEPEMQMLLWCMHPQLDDTMAARIVQVSRSGVDWARFQELIAHHQVQPLAYRGLQIVGLDAFPQAVVAELQHATRANAHRALLLTRRLLLLLAHFADHKIVAIPYKGPVLAAMVYGDVALRRMGDLDILVYLHDIEQATALLHAQGYRLPFGRPASYRGYHAHFADNMVSVELHWAVADHMHAVPLSLLHSVDTGITTTTLAGQSVLALADEDMLILLCIHGMKHCWERLIWISDVAWLVAKNPSLNWQQVMARAEEWHVQRILLLGLSLARSLFQVDVPAQVVQRIQRDHATLVLTARIQGRLSSLLHRPKGRDKDVLHWLSRERLRDRILYAQHRGSQFLRFSLQPNAHDFAVVQLPAAWSFLYYLIRPLRIVRDRKRLLAQARAWHAPDVPT